MPTPLYINPARLNRTLAELGRIGETPHAPAAMLFVPNVGGISHSPQEFSSPQDCGNGAQGLLQLLLLADQQL